MRYDPLKAWCEKNDCHGAVEDSLQRDRVRKQKVHKECMELILGHKRKTPEQVLKELDEGDWV